MSKLDGHGAITKQAILEISATYSEHLIVKNLKHKGIPEAVVNRDILDVVTIGHWADFGQKHHFMRRFDGQSHIQAFEEGLNWIESNALKAAKLLAKRTNRYIDKLPSDGVTSGAAVKLGSIQQYNGSESSARKILQGVFVQTENSAYYEDSPNWQPFGNALHALQDSFSIGHVM